MYRKHYMSQMTTNVYEEDLQKINEDIHVVMIRGTQRVN